MSQIREEVSFTKGRIIVRGKLVSRGKPKRADYVLYYKPNIPLALIEAKDNSHAVGDGMQQGLDYATTLHIPFVFSSNGDGFVFHDRTGSGGATETNLSLDTFPPPAELWGRYRAWKGLTPEAEQIVLQDYFDDGTMVNDFRPFGAYSRISRQAESSAALPRWHCRSRSGRRSWVRTRGIFSAAPRGL